MKDTKTILLLIVSVLLIIASVALLWSWGYQFSFGKKKSDPPKTIAVKDSSAVRQISDSLQKAYYSTLGKLDQSIDSVWNSGDSLKENLNERLKEFYALRAAITDIFANRRGDNDIIFARQKIAELQERVMRLRVNNEDVQAENKRLNALLHELSAYQPRAISAPQPVAANRNASTKTVAYGSDFIASDLHLAAMREEEDNNKAGGLQVDQAATFVGSFTVKNNSGQDNSTEVMVVVLQPDGKVLQKSAWESGTFDTQDGKKIYSCKLKMDYDNGEAKQLSFSLPSDKYQKGNYTMQVYYKGVVIGRLTKMMG